MENNTPNVKLLDKKWLHSKYVVEQVSMRRIAEEVGTTTATVSKYIKRYGFDVRSGGESKTLTSIQVLKKPQEDLLANKQWLQEKYVGENLSTREIAALCNVKSRRKVKRALAFHGILVRTLKEARKSRIEKGAELYATSNPGANDLTYIKFLHDSGKSITEIETIIGVSTDAVRHRFKKAGITSRKPSHYNVGRKNSKETLEKMSDTATKQILAGTRSSHCQGNRLSTLVQGGKLVKVRSSYEKVYADSLRLKGIPFEYEQKVFKLSNGKSYIPDFYLPNTDEFIEIKGYASDEQLKKYELFRKEYPDIKWSMLKTEDLKDLGLNTRQAFPTIYMVCGASGSGKSWVCRQLTEQYNYISYDENSKKKHIDLLKGADQSRPTLYDPPIKISTFIKRHSHEFHIVPIFIIEDVNIVKDRILGRGGEWTDFIGRRCEAMKKRNAKYGVFSGTSQEVLDYLLRLTIQFPGMISS